MALGYDKGQHVDTPLGPGVVDYQRMAPPLYNEVFVVSVALDARRGDPQYSGTVFAARDITPRA